MRLFLLILVLLAGCKTDAAVSERIDAPAGEAAGELRVAVRVFDLARPVGTFTVNEDLWRLLDETAVDPATRRALWANGLRVGVGPASELPRVAEALGTADAPARTAVAADAGPQTIHLDRGPAENAGPGRQTLIWFDADLRPTGRTYQDAANRLALTFGPAPGRRASAVRIALTPIVRAGRSRQYARADGDDYQVGAVRDEAVFDLGLAVDVPDDAFLLIAPSPDAANVTSLGNAFLRREADGRREELGLLILPGRLRLTETQSPSPGR